MNEVQAPKALHDRLDQLYLLAKVAQNVGMRSQIVLSLDEYGRLMGQKVNIAKDGLHDIDSD